MKKEPVTVKLSSIMLAISICLATMLVFTAGQWYKEQDHKRHVSNRVQGQIADSKRKAMKEYTMSTGKLLLTRAIKGWNTF